MNLAARPSFVLLALLLAPAVGRAQEERSVYRLEGESRPVIATVTLFESPPRVVGERVDGRYVVRQVGWERRLELELQAADDVRLLRGAAWRTEQVIGAEVAPSRGAAGALRGGAGGASLRVALHLHEDGGCRLELRRGERLLLRAWGRRTDPPLPGAVPRPTPTPAPEPPPPAARIGPPDGALGLETVDGPALEGTRAERFVLVPAGAPFSGLVIATVR